MRYTGKLTNWKDDKGFGFITSNRSGKQVFVHIKSFMNRQRRPVCNDTLTYELKTDQKGREQAERVLFQGEQLSSNSSSSDNSSLFFDSSFPFIVAGMFITVVAVLTFVGKLPWFILAGYLIVSVVTFIAYSIDKSAARNDQWRTPESTLHFFAVIGGWPGALTAQKLLHHKSKKKSFQNVFLATVILNCSIFGLLFTPWGTDMIHSLLSKV